MYVAAYILDVKQYINQPFTVKLLFNFQGIRDACSLLLFFILFN